MQGTRTWRSPSIAFQVQELIDDLAGVELGSVVEAMRRVRTGEQRQLPREEWGDPHAQYQLLGQRGAAELASGTDAQGDEYREAFRRMSARIAARELTEAEFEAGVVAAILSRHGEVARAAYADYVDAVEWSAERELPVLVGSGKQRLHAELVRRWTLKPHYQGPRILPYSPDLLSRLTAETRASWWIAYCGLYRFVLRRGDRRSPAADLVDGFCHSPQAVEKMVGVMAAISQALDTRKAKTESVEDDEEVRQVEMKYQLRALGATSSEQRLFARKIRARAMRDGSDPDAMRTLRTARQVISFWRGEYDDAALQRLRRQA
jgi:hypothetical protein